MPAPIAVFAFNRPEHLRRTLAALADNDLAAESDLTIFCDGPRSETEKSRTDAVREVAQAASGFKSLTVIAQDANQGLATSIINGVTRMVEQCGVVIVLEDDLVTSSYFLRYMNDGLEMYADNPKVASIHGWVFPHTVENAPETFFLKGADCWGWGTWKRAWALFEPAAETLLAALGRLELDHAFNCNGSYDYMGMLRACRGGKVSSWAVRWRATAFIHDMFTLYPGRSLVQNIGGDGQGTNVGTTDLFDVVLADSPVLVERQTPQENPVMLLANMKFHFRFHEAPSRWRTLKQCIRSRLPFLPSRQQCKNLLKDCLPPMALRLLQRGHARTMVQHWEGDYPDWQSAVAASGGYDQEAIFLKVRDAARAVRDGRALWERDSVLFYHEAYNLPLLACLMTVAAQNHGRLSVLDFGGAFGSIYMQHRPLLQKLEKLSWNIVEQPSIVACGREEFSTDQLQFWPSLECYSADNNNVGVVLFSSVLQYLEAPYNILEKAIKLSPLWIIIDRTPFNSVSNAIEDKLTVQIPHAIYQKSSYPMWIFSENKFLCHMKKFNYKLDISFVALDGVYSDCIFKGFFMTR